MGPSETIYRAQSLPLIPIIVQSNERGILVDAARVRKASVEYAKKMDAAKKVALAYCGFPLNVGSNSQLKMWLYNIEGLPAQHKKATKKPTIEEDTIAFLRGLFDPAPDLDDEAQNGVTVENCLSRIEEGAHPLLEARIVYARALQAESHYIRPALHAVESGQSRIYPQTNIHAQASGRHSIANPPMQQIPSDLRDIVRPDPGEVWIEFDWSNIETWELGVLAADQKLLAAKEGGHDTHTLNACTLFNLPDPPVKTKALHKCPECEEWREAVNWAGDEDPRRKFAKVVAYRIHYRGYPDEKMPGVKRLGLDGKRLKQIHQAYLAAHPWIVAYWAKSDRLAAETGYTRTFMGRKRRSMVWQRGKPLPESVKRELANHPLQGGVADILNTTLIEIKRACPDARVVFTRHDSACIGCPATKADEYEQKIRHIVEREFTINGQNVTFPATFKERRKG